MITVGKKIYREKLRKKYELIRITRAASRANPVLSPNGEDWPLHNFAILLLFHFAILLFFCILLFCNFLLNTANLSIFDKSLLECSSETVFVPAVASNFCFRLKNFFLLSSQVLFPHLGRIPVSCKIYLPSPPKHEWSIDHTLVLALILLEHLQNSTVSEM